jgi:hypothetical protein
MKKITIPVKTAAVISGSAVMVRVMSSGALDSGIMNVMNTL